MQSSEYFRNYELYLSPHLRFSFTVPIAKCGLKEVFWENGRKTAKGDLDDVIALGPTNSAELVKFILLLSLKLQVISASVLGERRSNCRPPASTLH